MQADWQLLRFWYRRKLLLRCSLQVQKAHNMKGNRKKAVRQWQ